jgi:HEAT repeat protein
VTILVGVLMAAAPGPRASEAGGGPAPRTGPAGSAQKPAANPGGGLREPDADGAAGTGDLSPRPASARSGGPASPDLDASSEITRFYIRQLGGEYAEPYRREARAFLVRAGGKALPFLIESLTDADLTRRAGVLDALGEIRDRRATPYLLKAYRATDSLLVRCKALEAAGKMVDATLFDWFVDRAEDPNVGLRSFALWSLGELRDARAVPLLLKKLDEERGYPLVTAIDALGKCGSHDLAFRMMDYLKYEDIHIRYVAAKALENVGDPRIAGLLFDAMERETESEVQEALARTLGKVGGREGVDRLVGLLKSSTSPLDQQLAEVGLSAAGPEAVYPLMEMAKEGDLTARIAACDILGDLHAANAAPLFEELLRDKDPSVRITALVGLGKCGDVGSLKALTKMARSGDDLVRRTAAAAIESVGERQKRAASRDAPAASTATASAAAKEETWRR